MALTTEELSNALLRAKLWGLGEYDEYLLHGFTSRLDPVLVARALLSLESCLAEVTRERDEARELSRSDNREILKLRARLAAIGDLLGESGCDCDCEHHPEEHDDDCERCLACRVDAAHTGGKGGAA